MATRLWPETPTLGARIAPFLLAGRPREVIRSALSHSKTHNFTRERYAPPDLIAQQRIIRGGPLE